MTDYRVQSTENRMRVTSHESRITNRGAVLILTFIIMVTLIAITVAFLYMTSTRLRGSGYDITSSQAFWLAEAGLQRYIYLLSDGTYDAGNHPDLNGSLSVEGSEIGTYSVEAFYDESITYELTSTGTVGVMSREITQSVFLNTSGFPDACCYAVYGNTSADTLQIKNPVTISGNVYYDGDVEVEAGASVINVYVYADNVSGDGTYEAKPIPDPPLSYPTLDNTDYTGAGGVITNFDSDINTYDTSASYLGYAGAWTADPKATVNINLSGILYYAKFTAKGSSSITGDGAIVCDNEVKLEGTTSVTPDPGGTIIIIARKKLEVKNNTIVNENTTLYSKGEGNKELKIKDSASVSGANLLAAAKMKIEGGTTSDSTLYHSALGDKIEVKGSDTTISNSTLLSQKKILIKDGATVGSDSILYITSGADKIELKDSGTSVDGSILSNEKFKIENATVTGTIYASEAELKSGTVNGSVVADEYKGDKIEADVTYNQSSLPGSLPAGLEPGDPSVRPQKNWNEVVPAT